MFFSGHVAELGKLKEEYITRQTDDLNELQNEFQARLNEGNVFLSNQFFQFNPSRPNPGRSKQVKFFFSHFFLVPQKIL